MVLGDDGIGEDAAVAPAAHAEAVGIGQPDGDHVIHGGLEIQHLFVAPVGGDRDLVFFAAARAAAVIHIHHHVAVGGEQLALEIEGVGILSVGTAVDAQQRRVLAAGLEIRRLGQQAVDFVAVLGLRS